MFLSNPAKCFPAVLLVLVMVTGCGWLNSAENTAVPAIPEPKSRLPFKTKEPETFQCEIVQTAGGVIRRTRLARKGNWQRIDFDFGDAGQRSILRTDKEHLIDNARRVYTEKTPLAGNTVEPPFSDLTHELLFADASRVNFEEIGSEGNIIKYRVSSEENNASESVIYFDPSIGLPVKQEFFSLNGEERSSQFLIEMVNFKTEPDADVFVLPTGFRKISTAEFLNTNER